MRFASYLKSGLLYNLAGELNLVCKVAIEKQ